MAGIDQKFSIPLSRVFAQVQGEVKQLGQTMILPEHVLLCLLKEKSSAAFQVFTLLNVDLEAFEAELRHSLLSREGVPVPEELTMSEEIKSVLGLSLEAQSVLQRPYIGTEHVLIGMLRDLSGRGYGLLRRAGVSYNQLLDLLQRIPLEPVGEANITSPTYGHLQEAPAKKLTIMEIIGQISPVFWGLLVLTVLSGMAIYNQWFRPDLAVFSFILLGWIVSVSLHEFGHALTAYLGGDYGVIERGYLSLNPLKYTNGFVSIILPVVVLLLGGIGLPGGAVYVNMAAIPDKRMHSLVSAAGPVMTGSIALLLASPFLLGLVPPKFGAHVDFWAALAFLTFVQLWAFVFNLIPIPGFDGFGIFRPFLPRNIAIHISRYGSLIFFGFIALYFSDTFVQRAFWQFIGAGLKLLGVDSDLVFLGLDLFHFW